MSFDGHQWNIPVESYLLTFMSMFSICSFPGISRGSCRLKKQNNILCWSTLWNDCSLVDETQKRWRSTWPTEIYSTHTYSYNILKVNPVLILFNFVLRWSWAINCDIITKVLLVLDVKSSENSKTVVLAVVQGRTARRECYWLNGMTTQGQLPAFTLSSSSWCHAAQTVKAPTGSHFKYFKNLPNHILLSQLMVINVSTTCHNQPG